MRLLLVADTYAPARNSGAVQLRDLVAEMVRCGHPVTVLVPGSDVRKLWEIEESNGARILRVRTPRAKDVGLVRRALAEMYMPFALLLGFRLSGLASESWDGVVWYSPTIFLGLVARRVKRRSECKGYLIVRDLFPDWAVDAGVMRKGITYRFFKAVERYQYRVADFIGVQTTSNVTLLAQDAPSGAHIEVLHNWLCTVSEGDVKDDPVGFDLDNLSCRIIFVYTGNMGVAQDMGMFLDLAERMADRSNVGFLFVGRGSEAPRLRESAAERSLSNVKFMDEIDNSRIPSLLKLCHVGIVALHPSHTTHNIPGKFVSYMSNGLPVLARVNPGNDLVSLVEGAGVGRVVEGSSLSKLYAAAVELAEDADARAEMGRAGRELSRRHFTPSSAVAQIVSRLTEVASDGVT